ncbi:MAG: hypothetical protein IPK73_20915 [Candidatus Obscuribacter sp.]|nr:hypothetical protein [Candidatus Obscuribacter sp.]MBK9276579.1 hypothetical protein [Candidatus Obscuribacter sp.]
MKNYHFKRTGRGSAAEMPLTLIILFAVFAFPLIDLISLGLSYGAAWFISFQCAQSASTQPDFDGCLATLLKKTSELNGQGLTTMLKMTPIAGYNGSGTDLFVDAVDFMDAGKCHTIGPNKAVPPPIDLTNRFYEIAAQTTYRVEPFISLHSVPFLASVPALGTPITLSVKVKRCAEFPQGLVRGPGNGTNLPANAAQPTQATSFASPILAAKEAAEPWNRPKIYEEIEASGSKIVDHTVVLVNSDNPDWTDTGLVVQPGQTIWIDFRADGVWGGQKGHYAPQLDADGHDYGGNVGYDRNEINVFGNKFPSINYNLVGTLDPRSSLIVAQPYDFNAGRELYKYSPTKTGALKLGFWNYFPTQLSHFPKGKPTQPEAEAYVRQYYDKNHIGTMTVRIIVCQ